MRRPGQYNPKAAQELIRAIETAFADVPYPGDANLIPAEYENYGDYPWVRDFFYHKHWRQFAARPKSLRTGEGRLPLLCTEAWHFYLPAYLIVSLKEDLGYLMPDVTEITVNELTLSEISPSHFWERIECLSVSQYRVVREYVNFVYARLDEYDQREYVLTQGFWNGFVPLIERLLSRTS